MEKTDLTRQFKSYYTAKTNPEILEFGPARYVSITGQGDPSGDAFSGDIQALYPVAYGVKGICKAQGSDFGVSKLEGLWWFDEEKYKGYSIDETPTLIPRSEWYYRLLIRMPDFVTERMVQQAVKNVVTKKKLTAAARVEYFEMTEGKSVQILHVGPFSSEPATLKILSTFMQEKKLAKNGLHHEIYLSDFRTTAPEKLKTILREPVV